jgi:hypothetical protein
MPGVKGKSGRKSKAEELGLSALLESSFGLKKRQAVIEHLANIATGDDPKAAVSAASLLLGYAFGKPTEKHEHSGGDSPVEIVISHVTGTQTAD